LTRSDAFCIVAATLERDNMHQSLSGYVRDQLQRRYDGPIPRQELRWVEELLNAERQMEDALSPVEKAVKRLCACYGELMLETARLEASRQVLSETPEPRWQREYKHRRDMAAAHSRALGSSNAALLSLLENDGN
jgi:hypothetical protein